MALLLFLYIIIQKYFCWVCNWHHWIGFILLSMWILHLYFSEQYLILYAIYKFAAYLFLFYFLVHRVLWLRAHGIAHPEPLTDGPEATVAATRTR